MVTIIDLVKRDAFTPAPGVAMRACWGESVLATHVEMTPQAEVPLHSHAEEQLGLVLEGELTLEVDGQQHQIGPGQAYILPRGVPHSGRAGTAGCRLIDVFQPVRSDYRAAQSSVDSAD